MPGPAFLEAFELVPDPPADADKGPSEDWQAGHAEGYAQGLADAAAEQGRLSQELIQALHDQAFGYFEAKDHLMRTLRPLFEALIAAFVPGLARDSLVPRVAETLVAMADTQMTAPITVAVSPDVLPILEQFGDRIDDHPLRITADPGLSDLQAVVSGAKGEAIVDLGVVLREAQDILSALGDVTQRKADHGS